MFIICLVSGFIIWKKTKNDRNHHKDYRIIKEKKKMTCCFRIIEKYLKDNGYDGLCKEDCGCKLDDLAPCGIDYSNCVPAYLQPDKGEYDFMMGENKPECKSDTSI
jgi:hypothetical protein